MDDNSLKNKIAIAGVGFTPQGKVPGRTALSFHLEACANAIHDSGLTKDEIDGLILYRHLEPSEDNFDVSGFLVAQHLGIRPTIVSQESLCYRTWLPYAAGLLHSGICKNILISYGDNGRSGKRAFSSEVKENKATDESAAFGDISLMSKYAMLARRAMYEHGTGPHVWKEIAASQRAWANLNPQANMYEKKLSTDDYLSGDYIIEPFRLYDATMQTDGGRAIILTTTERARHLKQPLVTVSGFGASNVSTLPLWQNFYDLNAGAAVASKKAFEMADISYKEIDACQIYDCFTYTVEATLRDYGFFAPGSSEEFFVPDRIGPGGTLPLNTSGGLLSEANHMGLTLISEAAMQLAGRCGDRQLGTLTNTKFPEYILCSDNGETFQSHLCIILKRGN